jgi:hypothetical protein
MVIIPTKRTFEINTGLEDTELKKRLCENVAKRRVFNPIPSNLFRGDVYDGGFDVKESVWYPHVFNPVFRGYFHERGKTITVSVSASNYYATLNTVSSWVVAFVMLGAAYHKLARGSYADAGLALVLGCWFAALAMFSGWLYDRGLQNGKQKLLSVIAPPYGRDKTKEGRSNDLMEPTG